MKKIIIIGCPGSGKSTFARKLRDVTNLPLYHLDNLYWNTDKTKVDTQIFRGKLFGIMNEEAWIMDGNFTSTLEMRIQACDTVIFMDYPTELCLESVRGRIGKERPDIPWIEEKEDEEFMEYIRNFKTNTKLRIVDILDRCADKNIIVLHSREEAEELLKQL